MKLDITPFVDLVDNFHDLQTTCPPHKTTEVQEYINEYITPLLLDVGYRLEIISRWCDVQ